MAISNLGGDPLAMTNDPFANLSTFGTSPGVLNNTLVSQGTAAAPVAGSTAQSYINSLNRPIPQQGGVLGISTGFEPSFQPNEAPVTGTGGGGGGGGASAAASQRALIDRRKGDLIQGATDRYNDEISSLDRAQQQFEGEVEGNRGQIQAEQQRAVQSAEARGRSNITQARQDYQDAIVSNRRRARATGGAATSSFLELSNLLDRELQQGVNNISTATQGVIGNAQSVAQRALADLETTLAKFKGDIQNKRDLSLREKNEAIRDAEFAAADQAVQLEQWLASRMSSGGGSSARAAAQQQANNLMASYARDVASGADAAQVAQAYAPLFAQYNVNPAEAQSYASFGQPQQVNPAVAQLGFDDPNITFDQGMGIRNYQLNQLKALNSGYDPMSNQVSPYTSQYLQQLRF